jgi:acyl-CoA thioesterase
MNGIGKDLPEDSFAKNMGIEILDASQEGATGRMQVTEAHLNAQNAVHPGVLFTLANAALNGVADGAEKHPSTASFEITFMKAALGKVIFARASRVAADEDSARYTVTLTADSGELLARLDAKVNLPAVQQEAADTSANEGAELASIRRRRRSVLPVQQYD